MINNTEQTLYKITELSKQLGVETSVLRFWEKEFGHEIKPIQVSPRKRLYREQDLEMFQIIKRLLYEDRFTIAGAKKRLSQDDLQGRLFTKDDYLKGPPGTKDSMEELSSLRAILNETRRNLIEIKNILLPAAALPTPLPPPLHPRKPISSKKALPYPSSPDRKNSTKKNPHDESD
ncbi:MAG: MerR family transcriptional regulator [Candidatus Adiutrix intracellularis]|nr:MerR family transcriptional regulator [Candidatus Adiutrix intracellularis]